jgi:hypothetical protein
VAALGGLVLLGAVGRQHVGLAQREVVERHLCTAAGRPHGISGWNLVQVGARRRHLGARYPDTGRVY